MTMQITFKKKELNTKLAAFSAILNAEKRLPAFVEYWAMKNRKTVAAEVETLGELQKSQLKEFNEAEKALIDFHTEKDASGKSVVENDKYKMADPKAFNADYETLVKKFKPAIEDFNKVLEENINLEAYTIDLKRIDSLEFAKGVIPELYDFIAE
jgi:hypothetical protein